MPYRDDLKTIKVEIGATNTNKRNQHYIPQFYLRLFSLLDEGKQIGVFNTETGLFVPAAKLKTQACKPFFYGIDGRIENELAQIESEIAPVLRNMIFSKSIPKIDSDTHLRILHFVVLMALRNPLASEQIIKSGESLREAISHLTDGKAEIDPTGMINQEEAIKTALEQIAMFVSFCTDLKLKIFINKTPVPFIIGDNPIVKYNQFLEQKKWPGNSTGYGSMGLQMFFPLNPSTMLILYDNRIYKVGDKKESALVMNNINEINQLNLLQFINCKSIIHFNEKISQQYLQQMLIESKKYQKANNPKTTIFPIIVNKGGKKHTDRVIRQSPSECKINLKISSITWTKKAKTYTFSKQAVQLRPRAHALMNIFFPQGNRQF